MILSGGVWGQTPERRKSWGEGRPIYVTFEPRHYNNETYQYTLVLPEPAAVAAAEWRTRVVAFVDPDRVGKTFVGTLTVIYDNKRQKQLLSAQLDALKQTPEKIPDAGDVE